MAPVLTNLPPLMQILLWAPTIVSFVLFAYSFYREPRQFRNCLFLFFTLLWTGVVLLLQYGNHYLALIMAALVMLSPVLLTISFTVNGIIAVKRLGICGTSLLPFAFAALMPCLVIGAVALIVGNTNQAIVFFAGLVFLEVLWFSFSFGALFVYSTLYRKLPHLRRYSYIVIHGAGLVGEEPSPLLAGRIDRALQLWRKQKCRAVFVASGGQGADEAVSEAEAMRRYLESHGVPPEQILKEDRSTTTWENLSFSRDVMNAHAHGKPWRCAVVTSDFHVFRCAEYAHKLGIAADGVGSRTRGWLWPASFLREFIAITKAHLLPFALIAVSWTLLYLTAYGPWQNIVSLL